MQFFRHRPAMLLLMIVLVYCPACSEARTYTPSNTPTRELSPTASQTAIPSNTATVTSSPSPSATPTPYPDFDPAGCLRPPDDYTRVTVNGWTLNARSYAMLQHAATLYRGEIDLAGRSITQGSYRENQGSFGTHLGGGAVDISVIRPGTWEVLWDDIPAVLRALRAAGFAAWLREYGELYPDSGIHIHAIAVGDAELSQPARDQLTGPAGYFRGYSGIPESIAPLAPDRYGGPVVCLWMLEIGYPEQVVEVDWMVTPHPTLPAGAGVRHTVLPGETIASIARQYGVAIATIAESNGLHHFQQLTVGQVLTIQQP